MARTLAAFALLYALFAVIRAELAVVHAPFAYSRAVVSEDDAGGKVLTLMACLSSAFMETLLCVLEFTVAFTIHVPT